MIYVITVIIRRFFNHILSDLCVIFSAFFKKNVFQGLVIRCLISLVIRQKFFPSKTVPKSSSTYKTELDFFRLFGRGKSSV